MRSRRKSGPNGGGHQSGPPGNQFFEQLPADAAHPGHPKEKPEVADYLLARGADVNAKESLRGDSPVLRHNGRVHRPGQDARRRRADIDTPAMWDMSPLAFALEFGRKDIAEMLADKGAALPVEPGEASYRLFFSACSNGSASWWTGCSRRASTSPITHTPGPAPLAAARRVGRDRREADRARLRHGPQERAGLGPAPRGRGERPRPGRGHPVVPRRGDRRPDALRQERL